MQATFQQERVKKVIIPLALVLSVPTSTHLGTGLVCSPGNNSWDLPERALSSFGPTNAHADAGACSTHPALPSPGWAPTCAAFHQRVGSPKTRRPLLGRSWHLLPMGQQSRTAIVPSAAQILTRRWEQHPRPAPPGWA